MDFQQDAFVEISDQHEQERNLNFNFKTGLNPDFVDRDQILDIPEGIEGPIPVYVNISESYTKIKLNS